MKKAGNKYADFFREAKKIMPEQNIQRAEEKATQILLNLRLAEGERTGDRCRMSEVRGHQGIKRYKAGITPLREGCLDG